MEKKKLIIYGIGNLAHYISYVFEKDSEFEVVAYCIEEKLFENPNFEQKPVIKLEEITENFSTEEYSIFIAVGDNVIRKRIYNYVKALDYSMASFISSKAITWDNLIIGENTFIDEGCKIHPFVTIGDNSIIMFSTIGHHVRIGNNNLLSVSTLGGSVRIGDDSFIGMNSVIKQNVIIGDKNIIGMGCVIENDTLENSVYSNKGTVKRNTTYDKVSSRFLK